MAKRKRTGPTWSDVKAVLGNMEQKQLIQLVGDLYRLSKDNKDFLHARFAVVGDPLVFPRARLGLMIRHEYGEA